MKKILFAALLLANRVYADPPAPSNFSVRDDGRPTWTHGFKEIAPCPQSQIEVLKKYIPTPGHDSSFRHDDSTLDRLTVGGWERASEVKWWDGVIQGTWNCSGNGLICHVILTANANMAGFSIWVWTPDGKSACSDHVEYDHVLTN